TSNESNTPKSHELPESLNLVLKTNASRCQWIEFDLLKASTSDFASENLIGKGGYHHVYKGTFPDGKSAAVKIRKSSREAWKDYILEIDIMTSLDHKNITPLLGVCVEDDNLISVYDLVPRGNLEDNLHGVMKDKSVLSWETRLNIAIGVAEALNYLHKECPRPVLHRDVKSSNILLSDEFEPQLSDFGLAIWGPTTSPFLSHSDVVGTFGYLAPEYFMYGKVSEKIDVYSFGVVLLELLTRKRPISPDPVKGEDSLVMWAKPKLEKGDLASILDVDLDKEVHKDQIARIARAATLCLTRSARRRPNMSQVIGILRGEHELDERTIQNDLTVSCNTEDDDDDDEVYPESNAESHLSLAFLDVEDKSMSFDSVDSHELPESLNLVLKTNASRCQWIEFDLLKASTSDFASENLIGKGGYHHVYKGTFPDGKSAAVKIRKSSREAWKDYILEIDIMTSLDHKNITPLLGVCVEDDNLISVYDLVPRGNLEDNLHGVMKDKSVLSWETRLNIAIGVAEALNYLHKECPRPVLHRDVKSSNILLSDEFEPQLRMYTEKKKNKNLAPNNEVMCFKEFEFSSYFENE
ncbi:hypothetical protein M8C21_015433, partial [Ambrosia artemisiifolia]